MIKAYSIRGAWLDMLCAQQDERVRLAYGQAAEYSVPLRRGIVDAHWREVFALMAPEVLPEMEALERELSPAHWQRGAMLLGQVDDQAYNRTRERMEAETAAILEHFPDIKPAWDVVATHLEGASLPECSRYSDRGPHHYPVPVHWLRASRFSLPGRRPAGA
jgi:hypothetical protein